MSEPRDRISEGLAKSTGLAQPGWAGRVETCVGSGALFQMSNFD